MEWIGYDGIRWDWELDLGNCDRQKRTVICGQQTQEEETEPELGNTNADAGYKGMNSGGYCRWECGGRPFYIYCCCCPSI
jgi:hypothetical protein